MYHEFVIVGRQKLENGKEHKLYRMRIFAKNAVSARNRFWYFLSRLRKVSTISFSDKISSVFTTIIIVLVFISFDCSFRQWF